jgi:hypothetical protein
MVHSLRRAGHAMQCAAGRGGDGETQVGVQEGAGDKTNIHFVPIFQSTSAFLLRLCWHKVRWLFTLRRTKLAISMNENCNVRQVY